MSCSARQYSDQMFCEKCKLQWDINDPEPPACNTVSVKETFLEKCDSTETFRKLDERKLVTQADKDRLAEIESKTINEILEQFK